MKRIVKSVIALTVVVVITLIALFTYYLVKWNNVRWAYHATVLTIKDPFDIRLNLRIERIRNENIQKCFAYIEGAKKDDALLDALLNKFQTKLTLKYPNTPPYTKDHPNKAPDVVSCPMTSEHWQELGSVLMAAYADKRVNSLSLFVFYHTKGNDEVGMNPFYDPEKSLYFLTLSAKEGVAASQLLLAYLYERGAVLDMVVPKDPVKGTAWRVNVFFGKKDRIILNDKEYEREQYINERCQLFKIENCRSVHEQVNQYLNQYPVTVPRIELTDSRNSDNAEEGKKCIEMMKQGLSQGYVKEMIAYGDSFSGSFFWCEKKLLGALDYLDYEEAEKWYLKAYQAGSPTAAYKLGLLYSTVGDEQYGFNPLYNEKKSLEHFEASGNAGNQNALSVLHEFYLDFPSTNKLSHFDRHDDEVIKAVNLIKIYLNVQTETVCQGGRESRLDEVLENKEYFTTAKNREQGRLIIKGYIENYDFAKNTAWHLIDTLNFIEIHDPAIVNEKLANYRHAHSQCEFRGRKLSDIEIERARLIVRNYLATVNKNH